MWYIEKEYQYCSWIPCIIQAKTCKKYQHKERYNPRKYHIYRKMIRKCKFQMAHNPWNINHFEKNVLGERQYPNKSKHQHNTTKSQKLKKAVSTCRESLTPQRTSTYKRPFTHVSNYLVLLLMPLKNHVWVL